MTLMNEWHRIPPSSGSFKFSHYRKSSVFLHKICEVQNVISKLNEKKNIRHGDIPTKFLNWSSCVVTTVLTHAFQLNRYMKEGIHPNYLKSPQSVPLHKSGDSTICSSYRLTSLLPQSNETFEKLLQHRL